MSDLRQPPDTGAASGVQPDAAMPPRDTHPARRDWLGLHQGLAALGLGSTPTGAPHAPHLTQARHLAFLPPEALELDLADPAQREFGDYELLGKLGQGGMGVVYRARQKSLDREVAVKLLAAGPWASRDFIERFRREAQSAARMQHPNIVSIFEVGAHDDLNYFSMQLVRGESLANLLAREGPQAPGRAAALLRTIAEAVDYAHRLGVLHLDLKPGNVLIDERSQPQVADFGLARRLDETLHIDSDEVSGTPSYMAPEQAVLKSHKLSPATDVYGLGAILYELLTGRPPFLGPNPQATLQRVVDADVEPPRRLCPALPADLEAICLKCLEKDPAQRYRDAGALAADLAAFLDDRPVSVRPLSAMQRLARAVRREPRIAALAALLALAMAGGLAATSLQWRRAEHGTRVVRDLLWSQRLEAADRLQAQRQPFAALPQLLATTAEAEAIGDSVTAMRNRQRIGILLANSPRLIAALALGEEISAVTIAPDGETIAVGTSNVSTGQALAAHVLLLDRRSGRELWRRSLAGLGGFMADDQKVARELQFTPDGHGLLVYRGLVPVFPKPHGMGMVLLDARSGEPRRPPPGAFAELSNTSFSADGEFALLRNSRNVGQLFRVQGWQALGPERDNHDWIVHLGPGAHYMVSGARLEQTARVYALPDQRLAMQVPTPGGVASWSFDRSGKWLALGLVNGQVLLVDCDRRSHRPLGPTPTTLVQQLHFSADGRALTAIAVDGSLMQWTLPEGALRQAGIREATPLEGLAVDASGTVLAAVEAAEWGLGRSTSTYLWRVPDRIHPGGIAGSLGRIVTGDRFGAGDVSVHGESGLVAVGTVAGTLSLWRLPPSPIRPARTTTLLASGLNFDGQRVADVQGRQVQLVDAANGTALAPPLVLPDAIGFAALSERNDVLALTVGRTLYRFQASDGVPLAAPLELPNSPQRLALSRDGRHVVATWLEHRDGHLREAVTAIARDATHYAPPVVLPGPLAGLAIDHGGGRVLAWRGSRIDVLELPSLRAAMAAIDVRGVPARGADGALPAMEVTGSNVTCTDVVAAADVAVVGRVEHTGDDQFRSSICRVSLHDGTVRDCVASEVAVDRLAADPSSRVIATATGLILREGASALRYGDAPERSFGLVTLSAQGTRLARVIDQSVEIFDTSAGARLSAPLPAMLGAGEELAQIAFAPDGNRLLGRSLGGRWLLWELPADARPLAAIAAESALLQRTELTAALAPDAAAALAANDPGPPAPARRPRVEAMRWIDDAPIAPRNAQAPAEAIDLGAWYNRAIPPFSLRPGFGIWIYAQRPEGLQRLLGVDYDIRGVIEVGWQPGGGKPVPPVRVPIAPARMAALHVLAAAPTLLQDSGDGPYLWVTLHRADGSHTRQPFRAQHELDPQWWDEAGEPEGHRSPPWVAWLTSHAQFVNSAAPNTLVEVRIANPEPDQDVVAVEFEADTALWAAPWILAATIEPPAAAPQPGLPAATQSCASCSGAPDGKLSPLRTPTAPGTDPNSADLASSSAPRGQR